MKITERNDFILVLFDLEIVLKLTPLCPKVSLYLLPPQPIIWIEPSLPLVCT